MRLTSGGGCSGGGGGGGDCGGEWNKEVDDAWVTKGGGKYRSGWRY